MKTRNERDRHHGVNGVTPRGVPAIEFNCEMSSGHFVRMYMFRKGLNSVCANGRTTTTRANPH